MIIKVLEHESRKVDPRFSEKIMLQQKAKRGMNDLKKSHPA